MIKEIAILSPVFTTLFWGINFFIQGGKKDNSKFNLGIFMLFAFLVYCSHAIYFTSQYNLYSYFEAIYIFSMLSVYPMYYTYIISLTSSRFELRKKMNRFLPAFLFSLIAIIMALLLTKEQQILYVKETLIDKNLKDLNVNNLIGIKGFVFLASRIVFLIQILYFGIKTVRFTTKHKQLLEDYYSNTEGKTLSWVNVINVISIAAAVASITFTLIGRSYFSQHEVSLLIPSVIFSSFIFFIGFKGNTQVHINSDLTAENIDFDVLDMNQDNHPLKVQLIELFEEKHFYKNVDLRITTVSDSLKTNRTYISRLINDEFGVNFNEFVNKYRISEAKKLLDDKANNMFTMEHIAEKSGFGSLNSFTRVFKEFEGVTPGQYKNKKI